MYPNTWEAKGKRFILVQLNILEKLYYKKESFTWVGYWPQKLDAAFLVEKVLPIKLWSKRNWYKLPQQRLKWDLKNYKKTQQK